MSYTRAQYCKAVLQAIGNNSPSTQTINWMVNWSAQEDNSVVQNKHNLFNTTQPMPGSHGGGSQGNIMYYTSFAQGVQATAITLKNGLYPELLRDLQTNNIQALCAGSPQLQKDMRTWGTGYNSWYCNTPATALLQQQYNGSTGGGSTNTPTVKQWYQYPRIDNYGAPDPFGGFPKPDSNIQCPDGTPVTSIAAGTVSGINSPSGAVPAWGASITIRLDVPINAIATHIAYLHMQPIPAALRVGQRVNAGDIVGYAGGRTSQGAQKVPLGFALYNGDVYGYGPTWSMYNGDPRLNMTPVLDKLAKNGIPGVSGGNGVLSSFTSGLPTISVGPNASVTQVLVAIDEFGKIKNPFDTSGNNVPQDSILGATFDDPMAWLAAVGTNTWDDTQAIGFRLVLFIIGAVLFYKVLSQFVDVGKVVQAGQNIGMLAAGL